MGTDGCKKYLVLLPCLQVGGTEIATLQLCRILLDEGAVVVLGAYHEYHDIMVRQFSDLGVEIRLLGLPRESGKPLRTFWRVFRAVRRLLAKESPDIVHVQYMTPTLAPLLAARLSGAPVLATIHVGSNHYDKIGRCMVRLSSSLLCSAFVCVSEYVQYSFFHSSHVYQLGALSGGYRIFTIPNCVDISSVSAVEGIHAEVLNALGQEPDVQLIGFVGRMEDIKGGDILLRAFAHISQVIPRTRLLMVGDGSRLDIYKRLAADLNIPDSVIWTGFKDRTEVFRLLHGVDIVAIPSREEGFGLSALEAMACKRAVVASAVGALQDIVVDGVTGVLVPPEDSTALATALLSLLHQPEQRNRMGYSGYQRAVDHFSSAPFRMRVLGLYRELLAC